MSNRAVVACADWATALDGCFDLILCNPPYIATCDMAGLMPEVARYEPPSALDGGPDGLAAYRHVLPEMVRLLNPRGTAVLEVGAGQAGTAAELARKVGLASEARCDLAGTPRTIVLRRALP
jgi:release factor glutamine methyltransferase